MITYNIMLLQTNLTVRWAGWSDGLAGIDEYELALFKLQPYGDQLAHRGIVALANKSLSANSTSFNTILVDAGKSREILFFIKYFFICKLLGSFA